MSVYMEENYVMNHKKMSEKYLYFCLFHPKIENEMEKSICSLFNLFFVGVRLHAQTIVLFFAIRLRSFNGDPAEENKIWDKQNGTFAETEELTKSIWIVRVFVLWPIFCCLPATQGISVNLVEILCFCGY